MNRLRPASAALFVGLNLLNEVGRFVEILKTGVVQHEAAVLDAGGKLCSELRVRSGLAPEKRADVWLEKVDDAVVGPLAL